MPSAPLPAASPSGAGFRYEQLAAQVRRLIASGTFRPGDRIPSVRRMSREQGVSVSTVLQAYRVLEAEGLLEAHPQSGYYVRAVVRRLPTEPAPTRPPLESGQVAVAQLIMEVLRDLSDPTIVPLGSAVPGAALLPEAALSRSLGRVARRGGLQAGYPPLQGSPALRHEIARRALLHGSTYGADDLVVTNGCMEALSLCLQAVTRPGDTVLVESPTYFGCLHLLATLGLKVLEVPTHPRTGLLLPAVEAALGRERVAACLVMPHFHNPLGSLMPDDHKRALLELLAPHGIPVVEDDLYGDLAFEGPRPRPLQAFDRGGQVLYCSSFSKTISPGLRVGFAAPGRYLQEVLSLKMARSFGTSGPPQLALADYLQRGGYDRHLNRLRRTLATNVDRMTQAVARFFPPGTRVTRPAGGFVLWVELPEGTDALRLHRAALDEQISIAPGPIFSATGGFSNFVRLNCGYPWSPRIEKALARLGALSR